jgi:parvulin-like peptidyl-prolyl isomerase
LAKKKGLEVKTSKPFDKEYGPSDLDLPPNYPVSDWFNLTADDPFLATPLKTEDGVYIVALNKFIPSRVPPLDEIRSRVVADFKEFQATRTAQVSARLFEQSATNGLAKGQTFAEITSAARLKPVDLPAFSANTESLPEVEDEVDLNSFKQNILETPTGKLSGLIPTRSGAMIVYVSERLPVDKAKMQADLPNFSKLVRQARQNQAFDMWFTKEFSDAARTIPALQQRRS